MATKPIADTPTQTREWQAEGIDCPNCAATLERAAHGVPGIVGAKVDVASGRLRVMVDPDSFGEQELVLAARRAGHPLVVDAPKSPVRRWGALALAAGLLAVGVGLEATATAGHAWLYLVAVFAAAVPLVPRVLGALRQRNVTMHVLIAVALAGALALGDWREAAVLAVLFGLAEWIESQSLRRTGRAVESLLELAPRSATVLRGGERVSVPVEDVAVGERVVVRPGDQIPVDGRVLEGTSAVDEAAVTGETYPASKAPGDDVFAATLALDGALTLEVTRAAGDSTLAKVVALVEAAQSEPSPTARTVDRFARWYTPTIVGLAALVAILPPLFFGQPWGEWFHRALVLLVIGCPCAIVIATPVAVYSGLTAAARRGILIRGGEPLEAAAGVTALALDKTGTLTRGRPRLAEIRALDGVGEDDALSLAAALEADSSHPLAAALREAAEARGLRPSPAADHRAEPGRGVTGRVDGRTYRLGSRRWLAAEGVDTAPADEAIAEFEANGWTTVLLAGGAPVAADAAVAVLALADEPRPEAAEALAALRREGVDRVVMLTGDNRRTAEAVGRQVGIEQIEAELLPQDKLETVRRLGPGTAMVGDGINDAPALAAADVGIAIGAAGSDIAMETADIALLGDDLRALVDLRRLARRTRSIILANIALAFAVRVILVPLAVTGNAGLALAILGDMGSSLLVTFNSLRILKNGESRNRNNREESAGS